MLQVQRKHVKCIETLEPGRRRMYRKKDNEQLEFENFYLPFGGQLRNDNRRVRLTKRIPWEKLESHYANLFSKDQGAPAKSFRMALGTLIIKEKRNISDEETVDQIRENPYLQYMIGLNECRDKTPFDPSMMVHFRKRLSPEISAEINEVIVNGALEKNGKDDNTRGQSNTKDTQPPEEEKHRAMLSLEQRLWCPVLLDIM